MTVIQDYEYPPNITTRNLYSQIAPELVLINNETRKESCGLWGLM